MISVCCIFPDGSEGTNTFPVFPVGGDTVEIKGICYVVQERALKGDRVILYLAMIGLGEEEEEEEVLE